MTQSLFISYRHQDASFARALQTSLETRLRAAVVMRDVSSISGGDDLRAAIPEMVERCDVVIALVGPGWSEPNDDDRVLQRVDDWVRFELSLALAWNRRVIPVLMGGASMPSGDQLPRDVRRFADVVAVSMRDADWDHDLDRLVGLIDPSAYRPRDRAASTISGVGPVAGGNVTIVGDVVAGRDMNTGRNGDDHDCR